MAKDKQTNKRKARENILSIISHQGNANQNHNEIQLHKHQDKNNQKDGKYQVFVRIWRNGNLHTLLMGM